MTQKKSFQEVMEGVEPKQKADLVSRVVLDSPFFKRDTIAITGIAAGNISYLRDKLLFLPGAEKVFLDGHTYSKVGGHDFVYNAIYLNYEERKCIASVREIGYNVVR
jgi:hypothetical protein